LGVDDGYFGERFPDRTMSFPPPPNPHVRAPGPPAVRYVPPPSPSKTGRRWGLRIGIALGLLTAAGVTFGLAQHRYLPDTAVLPGLRIDGSELAPASDAAQVKAAVTARAGALAAKKVRFQIPGDAQPALETTLGELGLRVDVDETVAIALRTGKSGDLLSRAATARDARAGKLDVPLLTTIDREKLVHVFEQVKEKEDREPVSARLDLDKHETIAEKEGRYVDVDGAAARVDQALHGERGDILAIDLPVATFAPRISSAFLAKLDIHTVVAEYDTYFGRGGDQKLRGKNIDNAAQKLDGLVISPGEMISFNNVVGERSEANGFYKSWEIFKGEMVEGMGGGTCQVASTFHAATFFAGFDVLERLPHSRPSAYIPMGLDSTVVFPGVDLKVRNPHPFPVVVHAKTDGNKLHIEILGKEKPVDVSFGREVLETLPYKRKIVEEPSLSGKKVVVKQHGIKGYKVKRSRTLKYADGRTKHEEATDVYPPTTEIYNVPVGFDVALLPKLPDGSEDADLGGNPSPAPAAAATPSPATPSPTTATADNTDAVQFVDAPGAHQPTQAQKDAAKSVFIKH
jgi:vancomycin resistance protein YoaR